MRLKTTRFFERSSQIRKLAIASSLGFAVLVASFPGLAQAQQDKNNAAATSDLEMQNLSRVAASAAEIRAILERDSGLLVELKRWIAKDATNHGQIVTDTDLTNEAVFQRLDTDVQLRAIATLMVQQFGYLTPQLNPASDMAKQQALIMQERTKLIAQDQEQQLAEARQLQIQKMKEVTGCDQRADSNCPRKQSTPSPADQQQQMPRQFPPSMNGPNIPYIQNQQGIDQNQLMRAQMLQSGQDAGGLPPQLSLFGGDASQLNGFGLNDVSMTGSLGSQSNGITANRMSGGAFAGQSSEPGSASDGLLAAYGAGNGGMPGMNGMSGGIAPDFSGMNGLGGSPTQSTFPSPVVPWGATNDSMNRLYQPSSSARPSEVVRKPGPYTDIPSLYDMYVQAIAHPAAPQRFGTEIFQNGTRDSQWIPMDLPAGPDYVVGPGDGLSVDLWGGVSQRLTRVVDREGRISLPEVGPVLVSGKTLAAVQENVQQILRTQFRDVSADVSLSRLRTIRVYEVGDIASPGAYDINSLSTPLNALFVAGGPTEGGSMRILKHFRGAELVETVDIYDLLLHGVKTDMVRLENGDTIQVPPIGPQVTVEGMVRRPAIYELRDEKTLASVLELAGGLLPAAALRHIEVQRIVEHDKQTMLSVDIPETQDTAEVTKKLESFEIHDGDRIRIYPIAPYNQDTIYVEGHVARPGRYSYRADMRVTDIISSYKDLLPQPSTQYAEIIRLNAPDFHPSVESFDLAAALADPTKAPVLYPMDTVRIFSRFDFENPPSVSVLGDVRSPGTFQTSGEIHLADAVHLAGGLTPDAQTENAQIFRYLPDGQFKIFSVSLGQALAGDPAENIILQSRDRLLIHKNPESVQPSSVYLQGEVARPGRYPLTTNMHVSDLIRIGGGLNPAADSQVADLTKFDWENQTKLTGQQESISVAKAMAGDTNANLILNNGDVLTIRQLPGWNDLGASIALKGEVVHPGTYGIRPGEKLSSVLERAGGFQADAYPYGAILQRGQVREVEAKEQASLVMRVKQVESRIEQMPENDPAQKQAKEAALQQYQTTLDQLSSTPPMGRLSVRIAGDINRWKNTPADVEVRAGDTLIIPKKPGYVMVTGQVYNGTAIAYRPGKSAKWYLSQAGGPTLLGDKKAVFVIRADGSVIGTKNGLWSGDSFSAVLQPGDTVVVPERAVGGPIQWQVIFSAAQVASAVASTMFIALHY